MQRARLSAASAGVLTLAALLAACSSTEKPKPTPLAAITPTFNATLAWQGTLDGIRYPLIVAAPAGAFVVADSNGTVVSLDANNGAEQWRASAGAPISAGVGSDGRFASVVTRDNALVVLDGGREIWRTTLAARVVTAPLVAGERVFVLRVDRIVEAYDVLDGRPLWTLSRPGDALTLEQAGVLVPYRDSLLAGQGPKLVAIDPLVGSVRWEAPIATPRGTNEVERLADLVGPPTRDGDVVCARAFQSAVGCVDASRGRALWSRPSGGAQAVGGDAELIVGADASGRITAWRRADGEVAWANETLLYRELSGAMLNGPVAVFGDLEGQVHFLSNKDGSEVLRLPTDGSAIVARPALSGTTMLVATRAGGLFAFRP